MAIESQLEYFFFDKAVLRRSLTPQRSDQSLITDAEDQIAYALVGEHLLKTVLIELLIRLGYTAEPELYAHLAQLTEFNYLVELSCWLEIDRSLKQNPGWEQPAEQPEILVRTLYALLGGIYFDGGFRSVRAVIEKLFGFNREE